MFNLVLNQLIDNVDDLYIMDFYKSDKLQKLVNNPKAKYIKHRLDEKTVEGDYLNAMRFAKDNNVENVFIIHTPILQDLKYENDAVYRRILSAIESGAKKNVISMSRRFEEFIAFTVGMKDANCFHIVFDSQELDYTVACKFKNMKRLYIMNKHEKNLHYAPLFEMKMPEEDVVKSRDFFFICGCTEKSRDYIKEFTNNDNDDDNFFFKHFDRIDKRFIITQAKYYEEIGKSKFTLVIPSYDKTTFSWIRFIEAVKKNCLPIIANTVCLDDLRFTFPDICDIVENRLIVDDYSKLKEKISELMDDRENILKAIKETKSYRKISNPRIVRKYYNKLLGVDND